ncbi:unnamed protein product [Ranitomeya imitator]|uniref:Uncharacterized protein n=1 Tax=Ranitomeya imitator TaxID=111125 RepID=A0ABN9L6P5_9NEOB|nr:unnamed protein product [Ranitomeya imitator]
MSLEAEYHDALISGFLWNKTCVLNDLLDYGQDTDLHGNLPPEETEEPVKEASGEPAQPAAPVAVPSRRNPPGGKSSLVLG